MNTTKQLIEQLEKLTNKKVILKENRNTLLYHSTDFQNAFNILKTGLIKNYESILKDSGNNPEEWYDDINYGKYIYTSPFMHDQNNFYGLSDLDVTFVIDASKLNKKKIKALGSDYEGGTIGISENIPLSKVTQVILHHKNKLFEQQLEEKGIKTSLQENTILKEVGEGNVTPYPYTMHKITNNWYEGRFTALDNEYDVQLQLSRADDNFLEISFTANYKTDETNQGDMYKVMSTITAICKEFLNDNPQVDEIVFEGKQKGNKNQRNSLYLSYIKKQLGSNWKIQTAGNIVLLTKENNLQENVDINRILSKTANKKYIGWQDWRKDHKEFSPMICNSGYCDVFATEFKKEYPEAIIFEASEEGLGHFFCKYKDKFYDAETPTGISDWKQLPYFKRWIQQEEKLPEVAEISILNRLDNEELRDYLQEKKMVGLKGKPKRFHLTPKNHKTISKPQALIDKCIKAGIKDKLDGVSLCELTIKEKGEEKKYYRVQTHRAGCPWYDSPESISIAHIKFIESTG